jgi:aminoglycoside 6'-N-acetyltransferase I
VTSARQLDAVTVRPVERRDADAWLRMRRDLWPEGDAAGHGTEIDAFLAGKLKMPLAVLIATNRSGEAIGFAELSIRAYAEDCVTDHVAYLEGWYVVPHARRQGVGRALVAAAEAWGLAQGCTEFASDALLDNAVSATAHRALGFEETVQIRCFKKILRPSQSNVHRSSVR